MRIIAATAMLTWASRIVVISGEEEMSSQVACVDRKAEAESPWSKHLLSDWSSRAWRKLITNILQDSSLSGAVSSVSSRSRVVRTGRNGNLELHVFRDDDTCSAQVAYYELLTPLHLELGGKVQHVEDYAYSPVVTVVAQPISINVELESSADMLEETPSPRRGWWQWWIPWKTLRDRSAKFNSFKYKMNDEAFAGGSHGEVWRGRRRCVKQQHSSAKEGCTEDPLVFKRLKVESGFRTLEAGLREVHFGNLLLQLSQDPRALFTQYIEHFFGDDGELWIVFADAGQSLRSLLYTATDAGGFVVFHQSWLWTLMRMSLRSKQDENSNNASNEGFSVAPFQRTQVEEARVIEDKTGKQLMKTFLRQVRKLCINEW
jgi:hypothetical protein